MALVRGGPHWVEPRWLEGAVWDAWAENVDAVFLLVLTPDGRARLFLPLPGRAHGAGLGRRGGEFGVWWRPDGDTLEAGSPVLCEASGKDLAALPAAACAAISARLPGLRLRKDKATPPWMEFFGWCTWDAFYQEVSAAKVRRGLRSLAAGGAGPRWMILDDGWQDTRGNLLWSTGANKKFPGGLAALSRSTRALGVEWLGVWHALHGYWHGIDPAGPLGQRLSPRAVPQTTERFRGWPAAHDPRVRHTIPAEKWEDFYSEFYRELAAAGVAFTKVDGQANTDYHADPGNSPARLHEAAQEALQGAAALRLKAGVVHCMAHAPDIWWRLATGNVWRNSDDFYPRKPLAAQLRHVVRNAASAILFGELAWPDWDMFHSKHPHAWTHAVARALSGGPVFVSDRPGAHDFALLRRLVLPDGRVPRFPRPGRPPASRWFDDPLAGRVPLVLGNASHAGVAAVAFFHCGAEEAMSGAMDFSWRPAELEGLGAGAELVVFDPLAETVERARRGQARREQLAAPGEVAVRVVSPLVGGLVAPLGLRGMPAGAAAVAAVALPELGRVRVEFAHAGEQVFWCARKPSAIWFEGGKRAARRTKSGLLTLRLPRPGAVTFVFAEKSP